MRILVALLAILLMAAIWDYFKGKIPNFLILAGVSLGAARICLYHGAEHIPFCFPALLVPIILLFPLYKIGTIGAGDLKLLSMLGWYFSFWETMYCIALSFVLGAGMALGLMLWRKNLINRMRYLFYYLRTIFFTGRFCYYYDDFSEKPECDESLSKMHFAIPIFWGVLIYVGGNYY